MWDPPVIPLPPKSLSLPAPPRARLPLPGSPVAEPPPAALPLAAVSPPPSFFPRSPLSSLPRRGVVRPRRACPPGHGTRLLMLGAVSPGPLGRRPWRACPQRSARDAPAPSPRRPDYGARPVRRSGPGAARPWRSPALARSAPSRRAPLPSPGSPAPPRACPWRRGPAARAVRRVPDATRPWLGAVDPRRSPAACAARLAPTRPRCLLATRARLGPSVCAARSWRVCAALRARVLACCAQCFGAARRVLGAMRSVLSRVTCSSTPRRARLPLATHLPPMYSMRSDHVTYINEMETQLRN
jgi:hypothetical protein